MKFLFRFWVCAVAVGVWSLVCASDIRAQQLSPATEKKSTESAADENVDPLVKQVEQAIDISRRRYLQADVHTPWQIMHGLLALRQEYRIKQNGKKVRVIDWMAKGATYGGEPWFEVTQYGGRAHPYSQDYLFEGHPNQFLAIISQANLPMDFKIKAGNRTITVADLVKHTQMEVNNQEEITWTLWALSHYLGHDAHWTNKWGESWSIERLVRIQTGESVYDAACGGTHALFALTCARNVYQKTGQPLRGVWLEADQKIQRYLNAARSLQNSDGTFSSSYFQSSGYGYDFDTRCSTSGHTLEFVTMALPQQRLKEQWVRNAVSAVAKGLIDHSSKPIECGALYHALSGLVIYRDRTQPETDTAVDTPITTTDQSNRQTDAQPPAETNKAQAELDKKRADAKTKRAVAEAKLATAKVKRAEAEAKRAEMERAEAEAKLAEAEAAQAEDEAKRAEDEAHSAEVKAKTATAASEEKTVNN